MDHDAEITLETMESIIDELELRVEEPEPAVTLQVHTIRQQDWTVGMADTGAVYELDWRDAFEGPEHKRGHHLKNDEDWNGRLLPELGQRPSRSRRTRKRACSGCVGTRG